MKSVIVKPDWFALLFHRRFVARSLILVQPDIELVRKADASWNFSSLGPASGSSNPQALPSVEIREATIGFTGPDTGSPRRAFSGVELLLGEAAPGKTYQAQVSAPLGTMGTVQRNPGSVELAGKSATMKGDLSITGELAATGALDASITWEAAPRGHLEIANFAVSSKRWKQAVKAPIVRLDFDPASLRADPVMVTSGNSQPHRQRNRHWIHHLDQPHLEAQVRAPTTSLEELLDIASTFNIPTIAGPIWLRGRASHRPSRLRSRDESGSYRLADAR